MKRHLILLFSILAGAAAAQTVMHNMVSRHTPVNTNLIGAVIGEGLSLSNGVLSSTGGGGGGGTDGQAVTNIVEGIVAADETLVRYASPGQDIVVNETIMVTNELGKRVWLQPDRIMAWTRPSDFEGDCILEFPEDTGGVIAVRGDLDAYAKANDLGTAAYKDASEFATATDEALVYQLLTNRLSGITFDFATVAGLYLAISNIVAAQGGAITNFPVIP